ncbi:MAG: hypothetical protein H7Z40_05490 [Phycisphaerae bacterium]|nr:hypothetical protein [Gemmatimonadaceae bacterium]
MSTVTPVIVLTTGSFQGGAMLIAANMTLMIVAALPQRPTAFETALPIPARSLALAKFLYALIASLVPIVVAAIFSYSRAPQAFHWGEAAQATLVVILAVLLPRLVRAREFSATPAESAYPLLFLMVGAAALILKTSVSIALTTLTVAVIATAVLWWRSIPAAYQVAPVAAARAERKQPSGRSRQGSWLRMLVRLSVSKQRVFAAIFMVFIGHTGQWWNAFIFFVINEALWHRTRFLSALPISHRARLWMLVGPGTIAPLALLVIGSQIQIPAWNYMQSLERGSPSTYKQEPRYFDSPTSVGMEYWAEATNGTVPTITSPSGETVEPYTIRVFGTIYYNPYTARRASSEAFTDWQFARLTTAVYGHAVARQEYKEDGAQPRRTTESLRMLLLNISAAVTVAFLLLFGLGLPRVHVFWNRQSLASTLSFVFLLGPMLAMVYTMFIVGAPQGAINCFIPLIERELLQLSAALPSNILAHLAVASAPVLASYSLLEWQFRNSEMTGPAQIV